MAQDNNYGMGREGRFDINGRELPKIDVVKRDDGFDGNKIMMRKIPTEDLIQMSREYKKKNGKFPTIARVPFENTGVKCFGRILKEGFLNLDIEYNSQVLEVV